MYGLIIIGHCTTEYGTVQHGQNHGRTTALRSLDCRYTTSVFLRCLLRVSTDQLFLSKEVPRGLSVDPGIFYN